MYPPTPPATVLRSKLCCAWPVFLMLKVTVPHGTVAGESVKPKSNSFTLTVDVCGDAHVPDAGVVVVVLPGVVVVVLPGVVVVLVGVGGAAVTLTLMPI